MGHVHSTHLRSSGPCSLTAPITPCLPRGCSDTFLDLMVFVNAHLDALDEFDYAGGASVIDDFCADARTALQGEELEATTVFASVFRASMAYWSRHDVGVPLRICKVDAVATLVHTHLQPHTSPDNALIYRSMARLLTARR
ncbi:MAG: hypothetical protein ACPHRO_05265 [Nannocystaceae bacterium]